MVHSHAGKYNLLGMGLKVSYSVPKEEETLPTFLCCPFLDLLGKQLISWLVRTWHLLGAGPLPWKVMCVHGCILSSRFPPGFLLVIGIPDWRGMEQGALLGFLGLSHIFQFSSVLPQRSRACWGVAICPARYIVQIVFPSSYCFLVLEFRSFYWGSFKERWGT